MLIYRFEDENGEGPYAQNEHYFNFVERHNNNIKKYPLARFDKTFKGDYPVPHGEYLKKFIYGFDSIKQAKQWFNSENISDMYDVQIFCFAYEMEENTDAYFSEKQVLFRREQSINKIFIDESDLLSKRFIEKRDRHLGY